MRFTVVTASNALLVITLALGAMVCSAVAQSRVQFPSPYQTAPPLVPVNPNIGAGAFPPQAGAYLGSAIQPFDPYALPDNWSGLGGTLPNVAPTPFPANVYGGPGLATPPTWPGGQAPSSAFPPGPISGTPPGLVPPSGAPYGQPTTPFNGGNGGLANDPYFRGSQFGYGLNRGPNYRNDGYGGGSGGYGNGGYGNGYGQGTGRARPPYQRLFQDTGLRGTYLFGRDKADLAMTEAEASTTAFFPNFLGGRNGLRVTPGFAFHWTDGPQAPVTSDVPARLYSGYLDFGLNPQFGPRFGAELTARVGIYSDFQSFNGDSIRILGSAVGVYQASPEVAIKFGAAYIDRVRLQLLPAAGILWTPNPQTRWDIFFPSPKLSNYWTTYGNQQVWWYLGGEYGGGSWSIEREENPLVGANERIDINDIRVFAGIEWWNLNRYYGFAEVGFVFEREVVFYRVPGDSLDLDETFMVRAGVSW